MEQTENTTKRQLFVTEKTEILTLEELRQTVNAKDLGQGSRTRPIAHFQFIEDIMKILKKAGQMPQLDHIYCVKSAGTKIIPKIEEQYGVKNVLEAWILDKVTGKIMIPSLSDEVMQCCIAFSYHDKGLDLAFGTDVRDCTNMSIFGSNILHTYGSKKDVNYERMLQVLKEWSTRLPEMHANDMEIIGKMMKVNVTGWEMLRFIGKLMVLAVESNMGMKVVAPLNVTQVGEVTRGIICKKGDKFYESTDCTLWEFYNFLNFVLKGNNTDITTLLTDICAISNMVCQEYKIVSTADINASKN